MGAATTSAAALQKDVRPAQQNGGGHTLCGRYPSGAPCGGNSSHNDEGYRRSHSVIFLGRRPHPSASALHSRGDSEIRPFTSALGAPCAANRLKKVPTLETTTTSFIITALHNFKTTRVKERRKGGRLWLLFRRGRRCFFEGGAAKKIRLPIAKGMASASAPEKGAKNCTLFGGVNFATTIFLTRDRGEARTQRVRLWKIGFDELFRDGRGCEGTK